MSMPALGAVIFEDSFSGTVLSKIWDLKHYKSASGTQWDPACVKLNGYGKLIITATKDASGVWHSGEISSAYATALSGPRYVEASVKVPHGTGVFAAPVWEWAWPWGAGGLEIDESEELGKDTSPWGYHTTLHNWAGGNKQYGGFNPLSVDPSLAYHKYGAAVYPDRVEFFFDRQPTLDSNGKPRIIYASQIGLTDLTAFKEAVNIDLDIGGWGGTPTIPGPAVMRVDYVRVWGLL